MICLNKPVALTMLGIIKPDLNNAIKMLRKLITNAIFFSGLPWLIRTFYLRNRITIIYYHNITPSLFNKHICFLNRWFNIIDLKSFVYSLKEIPPWAMVITVDDGHKNNFNLLDIISTKKIPITIFLTTQVVTFKKKFWFLNVDPTVKERLKKVDDYQRIAIQEQNGFIEDKEFEEGEGLTHEQLKKMLLHVDFQSHTATHPILPNCKEDKVEFELRKSKEDVEKLTGSECYALAFPNGDYTQREVDVAKKVGYKCTLGCGQQSNTKDADLFNLKRISASDSSSTYELALRVTSIWSFLKRKHKEF